MDATELCFLSAVELGRLIESRQVSPVEVVQAHLERIEATEATLNSFITRPGEESLEAARQAETEIAAGEYRGRPTWGARGIEGPVLREGDAEHVRVPHLR